MVGSNHLFIEKGDGVIIKIIIIRVTQTENLGGIEIIHDTVISGVIEVSNPIIVGGMIGTLAKGQGNLIIIEDIEIWIIDSVASKGVNASTIMTMHHVLIDVAGGMDMGFHPTVQDNKILIERILI